MKKRIIILITAMLLTLLSMAQATAKEYRVPDTGITKCYDNSREIPCPKQGQPFYGQDAQYDGN
ncbi:MAG: hypothetical protein HQK62_13570 [Desulfamplus sp.]|nr:hypothetical protein [Desulfamplus sp.]